MSSGFGYGVVGHGLGFRVLKGAVNIGTGIGTIPARKPSKIVLLGCLDSQTKSGIVLGFYKH